MRPLLYELFKFKVLEVQKKDDAIKLVGGLGKRHRIKYM